jgi:hypothetical protein
VECSDVVIDGGQMERVVFFFQNRYELQILVPITIGHIAMDKREVFTKIIPH